MDVEKLFKLIKPKYNIQFDLKQEQTDIICNVLAGKSTLGILPTGYGKSMTFLLPALLMDEVSQLQATFTL